MALSAAPRSSGMSAVVWRAGSVGAIPEKPDEDGGEPRNVGNKLHHESKHTVPPLFTMNVPKFQSPVRFSVSV